MEQIAVSFTDWWVPKTWLKPKVNIIGRDWTVYVQNGELKEVWYWWYIYNFDKYNNERVYLYQFDGGSELTSDYDRYVFGWNELDAYSNKYAWGRTAAPYFTSVNGRFDSVDKAIKEAVKSRKEYNDKEVKKSLSEIKTAIKWKGWYDVYKKLDSLDKILGEIKQSVVDTSATNDSNSSQNFSGINGKLDLMAEYVVKIKSELDNQLSTLDEDIAQRITESNDSLNESMSSRVTLDQLLQQVERLEDRLNEVVDAVVSKRLPRELTDKFDLSVSRKPAMTDDEAMALISGQNSPVEEEIWMELGEPRTEWMNAPVDMQGIAEPVMPNWAL